MTYPDKMIRGISSKDFIDAEGRTSLSLFQFSDNIRKDGFAEVSINWYDEESALDCAMNQCKEDGSYQFKVGVAILPRSWIDSLMLQPTGKGILDYERNILPNNSFHGNLLRKDSVINKQIRTVIAASIAMGVERIIERT